VTQSCSPVVEGCGGLAGAVVGCGVTRLDGDGPDEFLEGVRGASVVEEGEATIDDHRAVLRIDGEGGIEITECGLVVAPVEVEHAAIVEGIGVAGSQLQGPIVVGERRGRGGDE